MQDRTRREQKEQVEALRGWVGSKQWEALVQIFLGPEHPKAEERRSVREALAVRHRECLRSNDLPGARYWMGRIEQLEELFQGQLITQKIQELTEGGRDEKLGQEDDVPDVFRGR